MSAAIAFAAAGGARRHGRGAGGRLAAEGRAAGPRTPSRAPAGGPRAGAPAAPGDLQARIDAAGSPAGLGARELMAVKVAAATAAGVVGARTRAGGAGPPGARAARARPRRRLPRPRALACPPRRGAGAANQARAAGAARPAAGLGRVRQLAPGGAARRRRARARSAGRGMARGRASGRGRRPAQRALDGHGGRAPLPEVRALVAALDRARRHGAPLGETLAAQARDARFALARHAREEAARAGPKIQLVVALLLVPSVLLLVARCPPGCRLVGVPGTGRLRGPVSS